MNKSNYVSLSGTLVKDAIIRKNDKGSDYVLFTLSVPQTGTKWYDYINCIAFSEMLQSLQRTHQKVFPIVLKEESIQVPLTRMARSIIQRMSLRKRSRW